MNGVQSLLGILFWYHPAVWLAGRRLRHLRELCCDAAVARRLRERTNAYAATLVRTPARAPAGGLQIGCGLLGLFENSSRLRRRLLHLKRPA
jgi:bla regulator protein BlaR1